MSDLPLPDRAHSAVQRFWAFSIPSFSEERGVGTVGILMAMIGSFDLGQE